MSDKGLLPSGTVFLGIERAPNGWIVWDRSSSREVFGCGPLAVAATPAMLAALLIRWAEAQERGE